MEKVLIQAGFLIFALAPMVCGIAMLMVLAREDAEPAGWRQWAWAISRVCLMGGPLWTAGLLRWLGIPQALSASQGWLLVLAVATPVLLAATMTRRDGIHPFTWLAYVAGVALAGTLPLYWLGEVGSANYRASYESAVIRPAATTCPARPFFAHLSDPHMSTQAVTGDGMDAGQTYVTGPFTAALKTVTPDVVLITGDITDTGTEAEWAVADRTLAGVAERAPVVLAPGNHDLVAWYGQDPDEGAEDFEYFVRLGRYLALQARVDSGVTAADGRPLSEVVRSQQPSSDVLGRRTATLQEECREGCQFASDMRIGAEPGRGNAGAGMSFAVCLNRCANTDHGARAAREISGEAWKRAEPDLFPLVRRFREGRFVVFVLNSVPVTSVWSYGASAVGGIDQQQLQRLEKMLDALPRTVESVAVAMHHPPFRGATQQPAGPENWRSPRQWYDSEWWAYAFLRNDYASARRLVDVLADYKDLHPDLDIALTYGHRHVSRLSRYRGLYALEAGAIRDRSLHAGIDAGGRLAIAACAF